VQSAAGDVGGAIGAAFALWHKLGGARSFVMDHAYWGPQFGSGDIKALISARETEIAAAGCSVEDVADETELYRPVAAAIAEGKVVGWFSESHGMGPAGARQSLHHLRSAPRRYEAVADWFEENDAVPFMMQVFQIREEKRILIPAVTHVDGSGRLQTSLSAHQSALSPADRGLLRSYRHPHGAQYLVQ
jgi:carbamoyltransferase